MERPTFIVHTEGSHVGRGWSVWVHRKGASANYLDALVRTYCFTLWGAKLWGRRKAQELATAEPFEVTP